MVFGEDGPGCGVAWDTKIFRNMREDEVAKRERDRWSLGWRLAVQFVGIAFLFVGILVVLAWSVREPLERMAYGFIEYFGEGGLFLGIVITDSCPFPPLTNEPLLYIGLEAGIPFYKVLWMASVASVLGGVLAYGIGRLLDCWGWLDWWLGHRRQRAEVWVERYGVWTVAVAAVTPIPFAMTAAVVGGLQLSFGLFLLATLCRVPRIAFYMFLIWVVI